MFLTAALCWSEESEFSTAASLTSNSAPKLWGYHLIRSEPVGVTITCEAATALSLKQTRTQRNNLFYLSFSQLRKGMPSINMKLEMVTIIACEVETEVFTSDKLQVGLWRYSFIKPHVEYFRILVCLWKNFEYFFLFCLFILRSSTDPFFLHVTKCLSCLRSPCFFFINETAAHQNARPECAWMPSVPLIDVCGFAEVLRGGQQTFVFTVCAID